jgi:hypothetical protein
VASDGARPAEAGLLDSTTMGEGGVSADGDVERDASPVACPALALGDGSSSWVTGTISGDSVQATLCPGAAAMDFENLGPMYAPAAFGYLSGGLPLYGPGLVFDAPRTAVPWRLDFELDGVFAEGATYESPDGGFIAVLSFEYVIPDTPGIDCRNLDASATCPAGCDTVPLTCLERCGPPDCRPHGTLVSYEASYHEQAPYDGAVAFRVSSVDADSGAESSPVHGSFEGTLANIDGGPGTVTMDLTF